MQRWCNIPGIPHERILGYSLHVCLSQWSAPPPFFITQLRLVPSPGPPNSNFKFHSRSRSSTTIPTTASMFCTRRCLAIVSLGQLRIPSDFVLMTDVKKHSFFFCIIKSEDKKDHAALARSLAASTLSPVVVPNYRLTAPDNKLQHPAHAQDVLELLTFLLSWSGPHGGCQSRTYYDPNRMFLISHSCGAHMLACILLDSSDPALVPPVELLRAVRGVVFSEGIYDIDALLRSFPTYRDWFIRDTFGDLPTYDRYSATKMTLREGSTHISWIIVHSSGDALVDALQSQEMYHHLQSLHQGGLQETGQVLKNWDDLKGDHSAVLQSGKYIQIVWDFIHMVSSA